MKTRAPLILTLLITAISSEGCRKPSDPAAVAATSSLLECAAKDLLGNSTPVLRLAGPGMCPGHFDIRPSQVSDLRRCRILLRLDFQKSLDRKLSGAKAEGLRITEIRLPGGMCEPESYLAACRQTADALVAEGLLDRVAADIRLGEIIARINRKVLGYRRRVTPLKGMPVLVGVHQEAFCKWLGLDVVATFTGADTAGVGQVDEAVRKGEQAEVKLIIANLPEGRRVADALAQRLGAKVVVFGNFPALNDGHSRFEDLLEANVAALLEVTGK